MTRPRPARQSSRAAAVRRPLTDTAGPDRPEWPVVGRRLVAVVGLAALCAGCGGGGGHRGDLRSLDELRASFTGQGLEVCAEREAESHVEGEVRTTTFDLAFDCDADDAAFVAAIELEDDAAGDGVASQFGVDAARGNRRALDAVWTFGDVVVVLSGPRDDAVADAVVEALDDLSRG